MLIILFSRECINSSRHGLPLKNHIFYSHFVSKILDISKFWWCLGTVALLRQAITGTSNDKIYDAIWYEQAFVSYLFDQLFEVTHILINAFTNFIPMA